MQTVEQLSYVPGKDDPAKTIMDRVGPELEKLPEIYGTRILVATAPSPETLGRSGLIIATSKAKDEGRWQGKVGLILQLGESALECDPRYPSYEWKGAKPKVGDWVFYRTSDAWEVGIGGVSCRLIWDSDIAGRVTDIEAVY